ncbi:MAG: uroporphyrinogen-III synthase [Hyphomonadaceae bacterium]
MTVKVIITRAAPGQVQTARNIAQQGLIPVSAPMLQLYARDVSLPDLTNYAGLLFTSANGVRFFVERVGAPKTHESLIAFCVGPATLAAAREAGFARCENANGNAQDLAELVQTKLTPADGKLLHVANAAAAGNLAKTLQAGGFEVDFVALYAADPAREPSETVAQLLAGNEPVVVLVHSAKGAEAFKKIYKLQTDAPHVLVAVSQNAAAPLAEFGFASVHISRRPNERALLSCLLIACTTL